jgi:hypothetical protein
MNKHQTPMDRWEAARGVKLDRPAPLPVEFPGDSHEVGPMTIVEINQRINEGLEVRIPAECFGDLMREARRLPRRTSWAVTIDRGEILIRKPDDGLKAEIIAIDEFDQIGAQKNPG